MKTEAEVRERLAEAQAELTETVEKYGRTHDNVDYIESEIQTLQWVLNG